MKKKESWKKVLKDTYFDKKSGRRKRKWTAKILKGGSLSPRFNAADEMCSLSKELSEITGFKERIVRYRERRSDDGKWENTRVRCSIWTVRKR